MASKNTPRDKAQRKIEERAHELQLREAVKWCNADPKRKAADAVKMDCFALLLGERPDRAARNLSAAIRERKLDGARMKRKDTELLTDDEYDELISRYINAGYAGEEHKDALLLLSTGFVQLLQARAEADGVCTPSELEKLKPGATPVANSWYQVITQLVQLLKVS